MYLTFVTMHGDHILLPEKKTKHFSNFETLDEFMEFDTVVSNLPLASRLQVKKQTHE